MKYSVKLAAIAAVLTLLVLLTSGARSDVKDDLEKHAGDLKTKLAAAEKQVQAAEVMVMTKQMELEIAEQQQATAQNEQDMLDPAADGLTKGNAAKALSTAKTNTRLAQSAVTAAERILVKKKKEAEERRTALAGPLGSLEALKEAQSANKKLKEYADKNDKAVKDLGDRVDQEMDRLKRERESLVDKLKQRDFDVDRRFEAVEKRVSDNEDGLNKAKRRLNNQKKSIDKVKNRLDDVERDLRTMRKDFDAAQIDISKLQVDKATALEVQKLQLEVDKVKEKATTSQLAALESVLNGKIEELKARTYVGPLYVVQPFIIRDVSGYPCSNSWGYLYDHRIVQVYR